LKLNKT